MKKKQLSILLLIFVMGVTLGILSLYTPKPKAASLNQFSAEQVAEYIQTISTVPHDVSETGALTDVRTYIQTTLTSMGLPSVTHAYPYHFEAYGSLPVEDITVTNVLTEIPGQNDSYILLVAHYDSSPGHRSAESSGSYGAADDGYGVGTMLEIANLLSHSDKPLVNGIKLLFTDAEEIALVGAQKEVDENPSYFDNVGFVINIEARGVKGPAIMFQTSLNNQKVIEFYRQANLPIAYSFAGDVYSKMPNGTDFTEFLRLDLNGINFAVLDNLDYYHTPRDNYDNISLTSIQHYGEQIYPLVNEYVYHTEYRDVHYFQANQNAIYFSFLPNVFITYKVSTGIIFMALTLLLLIGTIVYYQLKQLCEWRKVLKWTGLYFLGMIGTLIVGYLLTQIISLISGVPFSITYMPKVTGSFVIFLLMIVIETALLLYFHKKTYRSIKQSNNMLLGAITFNSLFLIIFMFVLAGGSYLFLWPIVLSLIGFILKAVLKQKTLSTIFIGLLMVIILILYIPIVYLLYLALTIGALSIIMLFAFFPITLLSTFAIKLWNE